MTVRMYKQFIWKSAFQCTQLFPGEEGSEIGSCTWRKLERQKIRTL